MTLCCFLFDHLFLVTLASLVFQNTQCMFYPQAFVEFVILFETHLPVHMITSV